MEHKVIECPHCGNELEPDFAEIKQEGNNLHEDLVEACELVVKHFGTHAKYDPAIIACKQAIAKAKGE